MTEARSSERVRATLEQKGELTGWKHVCVSPFSTSRCTICLDMCVRLRVVRCKQLDLFFCFMNYVEHFHDTDPWLFLGTEISMGFCSCSKVALLALRETCGEVHELW
jgi:hypothetical protein